MAGIPVKLTFDPSYSDHARALEILRAQKYTTQFVVNLILGAAAGVSDAAPVREVNIGDRLVTRVTQKLPTSNPQASHKDGMTTLDDIPNELLEFIGEE